MQSIKDVFELPESQERTVPAKPGKMLTKNDDKAAKLLQVMASMYQLGMQKLIHMMRFSRPKGYNAVQELSRFMSEPNKKHLEAMQHFMYYEVATPERQL